MLRTTVFVAFAMAVSAMTPPTALGQAGSGPTLTAVDGGPLLTANPTLHDSLQRIARGSALWRDALHALIGTGRRALVLTPDQVLVADDGKGTETFDRNILAAAAPVPDADSRVHVVVVVVNLPLMERIHRASDWPLRDFEADVDRVLVHEIYGHAIPYLLAGSLSGQCADPGPNERASNACAIQRENAVRAELRLGRRTDYGLRGLALARNWR